MVYGPDKGKAASMRGVRYGVLLVLLTLSRAWGTTLLEWDFRAGVHGWQGNPRVAPVQSTAEGLVVRALGPDPWIEGPPVDIPPDHLLRVTLRLRSTADGSGQLFYGTHFRAEQVLGLLIFNDNQWHDYTLMIPEPLGRATRFRLDPCHDKGLTVVQSMRLDLIRRPEAPVFEKPRAFSGQGKIHTCTSGGVQLRHADRAWGSFVLSVGGQEMCQGFSAEMLGVQINGHNEWLPLNAPEVTTRVESDGIRGFTVTARTKDSGGAQWMMERRFVPQADSATIEVTTTLQVDQDRALLSIPWLTLLPGFTTFGAQKHQGLFAGMEYLSNEPSSSTADIGGAGHVRRIPDPINITFPLMALEYAGRYIGVVWDKSDLVAAGFDSPDRVFQSDAHALWLSGPGVGDRRFAHDLPAHSPLAIAANTPFTVRAWIIGGRGSSIVPAVQHYVRLKGFPALPEFAGGLQRAVTLLAHGWLDSTINEDWRFRHAVWGDSFRATPAADAAALMRCLAETTTDRDLGTRLHEGSQKTLTQLRASDPYTSSVSHVRTPLAPLLFGRMDEYVHQQRTQARNQLRGFDAAGRLLYRPNHNKPDYSRTHFAKHANGLGGRAVMEILQAVTLCADRSLEQQALDLLGKQTALYAHTVPRGAQTWEMPLHTPDILAAAHMIRAYVYGYLLSDRVECLEQARYWAWTGVPFLYLQNPTQNPVGPYATIAVLGATNWQAPVWFGQPVQWCGLVYASALHLLADHDPTGPWRKLARGITLTGLQMTWSEDDEERQGLLPDYFHLRAQVSDGPAINPGTVGAHVLEAFAEGALYDIQRTRVGPWFIHAPGKISMLQDDSEQVSFKVQRVLKDRSLKNRHHVLVSGLAAEPSRIEVQIPSNGHWMKLDTAHYHYDPVGFAVLPLQGSAVVRITK